MFPLCCWQLRSPTLWPTDRYAKTGHEHPDNASFLLNVEIAMMPARLPAGAKVQAGARVPATFLSSRESTGTAPSVLHEAPNLDH